MTYRIVQIVAPLALLSLLGCAHHVPPANQEQLPGLAVGGAFIAGGAVARLALAFPRPGATWKDCVAAATFADTLPGIGLLAIQRAESPVSLSVALRECVDRYGVPSVDELADPLTRHSLDLAIGGLLDGVGLPVGAALPPCEAAWVSAVRGFVANASGPVLAALADPAHTVVVEWPGVAAGACGGKQ